jgi:predicted CxxxxCH...CXXCH cytochrome family protein
MSRLITASDVKWIVAMLVLAGCASERALPDGDIATGVHPSGMLDEGSENFHARELARRGWNLALCAKCHGDDYRGGAAGVGCLSCHETGPDACETCHRGGSTPGPNAPTTGAHAAHAGEQCGECHLVPARWDAPGHILNDDDPAEVTFGARAGLTLDAADRAGPPAFVDGTCANVYCHGDVLHAGGGSATRPRWDAPAPTGGCDRCHGEPPPSHARTDCVTCHREAPHVDGAVQVGGDCNGCHGSATSSAPPRDLAGNMFTTALGVGAHQVHLTAPSRLRGAIECSTCHRVPSTIGGAGHIDSPAPAEVEPTLGWNRATETCSNAWCHGSAAPRWTGSGEVTCGSCHGMPPADANHTPGMTLGGCAACHPRSIDATGAFVFDGTISQHMDGDVDVF